MSFSEKGYEVVRNVLPDQLLENLKIQFQMIRDIEFFKTGEKNDYAFGAFQCHNSFSVYSPLFSESLGIQLKDKISEIVKHDLCPTYTYARIYYEGAILKPHIDRPSCEYSATVCIDTTDIWDFHIKDKSGKENSLKLNPGDMCVYSGCELQHWRNQYEGEMQMQCFLHYVDSEGINADYKYDKRPMMGIGFSVSRELFKKNNFLYQ